MVNTELSGILDPNDQLHRIDQSKESKYYLIQPLEEQSSHCEWFGCVSIRSIFGELNRDSSESYRTDLCYLSRKSNDHRPEIIRWRLDHPNRSVIQLETRANSNPSETSVLFLQTEVWPRFSVRHQSTIV